jgi:hypothetical protein
VKQGELGVFILEKSTATFFASTIARTALVSGFRTSFVDRNRDFENAPNMSFGSNGGHWVRSFQKTQHEFFRFSRGQNCPQGRVSREFCQPKPKLRKRTKQEFWVKWGGLGAFILKKSTRSFFAPQVARRALGQVLHKFCRPKPKLRKRSKHEFWVKRG